MALGQARLGLRRKVVAEGPAEGETLGVLPMRCEHQHRSQAFAQRPGHPPAPKTLEASRQAMDQVVDLHLFERHRTDPVLDKFHVPAEPLQPAHDLLGIGHVSTEQQQLHRRRHRQQHALVMVAPILVGQPLVFVHDQQPKRLAAVEGNLAGPLRIGDSPQMP